MRDKIAIIGMSFALPGVAGYADLASAVRNGDNLIRGLSAARHTDIANRFGVQDLMDGGYLERIDLFDNDYFGIVPQESLRMDPDQRLMLEHALKAIYNAGYSEKYIKENDVGFYSIHEGFNYRAFFDDESHLSLSSHLTGMSITRVANFLDIRGPVVGYQTTCSSALTAFHYACVGLANKECDVALAGGAKLNVLRREDAHRSPVISKSGRCRPFDNAADGTMIGEGTICLLLKRLEDAKRDKDFIYAVVAGSAINHGGSRLPNLTAPSEDAQTDVLIKAWGNAGIDPADLGFIEAHGTGTILGDPIEYAGIVNAFKRLGITDHRCSVSSAKGQMGHLDTLAGMLGVLRAIVALREHILPKQVGLGNVNSFLLSSNTVQIQGATQDWRVPAGKTRTAGVSSLGLTGTNVHVVLEESSMVPDESMISERSAQSVWLPHSTGQLLLNMAFPAESGLRNTAAWVADFLGMNNVDLKSLCAYLERIYSKGEYRKSILFTTRLELIAGLKDPDVVKAPATRVFYLIFASITAFTKSDIIAFRQLSPTLGAIWDDFLQKSCLTEDAFDARSANILFLYLLISYIRSLTGSTTNLVFLNEGAPIQKLYTQSLSIHELLNPPPVPPSSPAAKKFNEEKFRAFVDELDEQQGHRIILADERNGAIKQLFTDRGKTITLLSDGPEQFLLLQSMLYQAGCKADVSNGPPSSPLGIPLPLLTPKRFWPASRRLTNDNRAAVDLVAAPVKTESIEIQDLPAALSAIWKEKLGIEQVIGDDDDFFEIGGNSLIGLDVLADIEGTIGVKLEYQDIFEYSTIAALADHIDKILHRNASPEIGPDGLDHLDHLDHFDRSGGYEKLVEQMENLPMVEERIPAHILITGATGFLGIYIVRELLTTTGARLLCLVRASSDNEARKRFMDIYCHYFPDSRDLAAGRLRVIKGDVTFDNLGLTAEGHELLGGIDTVYHLAANVAHFGKYASSEKINYGGTRIVFDWAKRAGVKVFNHFSTLSVIGSHIPGVGRFDFLESDLDVGQEFGNQIYSKTKFLAEQYIAANTASGMEYHIFRTGNISGATGSGAFQTNIDKNNVYLALRTIASLKLFPEEFLHQTIEMSPVDIMASIITRLSLRRNPLLKTFHLYNDSPYTFGEIVDVMNREGIEVKIVPLSEFQQAISAAGALSDFVSLGVVRYASNNDPGAASTVFHVRREATGSFLRRLPPENGYERDEYIQTVIRYCIGSGFISMGQYT